MDQIKKERPSEKRVQEFGRDIQDLDDNIEYSTYIDISGCISTYIDLMGYIAIGYITYVAIADEVKVRSHCDRFEYGENLYKTTTRKL